MDKNITLIGGNGGGQTTNVHDFRAVLIEAAIGMPIHAGRW